MLPSLRTRLKVPSSKNQALQDILNSCKYGVEILQVVPFKTKLHNTLITLRVDLGPDVPPEQRHQIRSHFYNRQNIDDLLAEEVFTVSDINQVIAQFNLKGYDFTTDDIEIVGGVVKALPQSLGYYNSEEVVDTCTPTELRWIPSANNAEDVNTDRVVLSYILEIDGDEAEKSRIFFEANASAVDIVMELFLDEEVGLMGNPSIRDYFHYSPFSDLSPGTEIRITGYDANMELEEGYTIQPYNVNLKLVPMNAFSLPDEPSDKSTWFDYVQQQFGGSRTIHSCGLLLGS